MKHHQLLPKLCLSCITTSQAFAPLSHKLPATLPPLQLSYSSIDSINMTGNSPSSNLTRRSPDMQPHFPQKTIPCSLVVERRNVITTSANLSSATFNLVGAGNVQHAESFIKTSSPSSMHNYLSALPAPILLKSPTKAQSPEEG